MRQGVADLEGFDHGFEFLDVFGKDAVFGGERNIFTDKIIDLLEITFGFYIVQKIQTLERAEKFHGDHVG